MGLHDPSFTLDFLLFILFSPSDLFLVLRCKGCLHCSLGNEHVTALDHCSRHSNFVLPFACHHRSPPIRSSSPVKADYLKHHPLCLDLQITQDWLADVTKALGLKTHLSHCTHCVRPLLVGPSDFLLSILRYPHLISSCSTDILASFIAFALTVSCHLFIQSPSYLISANYDSSHLPHSLSLAGLILYFSLFFFF